MGIFNFWVLEFFSFMQDTTSSYSSHAKDLKKMTMTNEVSSAPSQIKHTGLSFQQTKALWEPQVSPAKALEDRVLCVAQRLLKT